MWPHNERIPSPPVNPPEWSLNEEEISAEERRAALRDVLLQLPGEDLVEAIFELADVWEVVDYFEEDIDDYLSGRPRKRGSGSADPPKMKKASPPVNRRRKSAG